METMARSHGIHCEIVQKPVVTAALLIGVTVTASFIGLTTDKA
jgi:hypothetical protein